MPISKVRNLDLKSYFIENVLRMLRSNDRYKWHIKVNVNSQDIEN